MSLSTENSPALVAGVFTKEESKKMPKVKITRDTVASGLDLKAGKSYELDEKDAVALINMGKAIPASGKSENREADGEAKKSTRAKK